MVPLTFNIGLFIAGVIIVAVVGVKLTSTADRLADITGLGEAIVGAVFLGAMTSLSGSITSVTAAWQGHPNFAVSNALGGIAAQMTFLAVADIAYRKANLEHAAASEENLLQASFLIFLLVLPVLAFAGPRMSWGPVHPVTPLMFASYGFGIYLISRSHKKPMWKPKLTPETKKDKAKEKTASKSEVIKLWLSFFMYAFLVGVAGWILARSGIFIANETGLSETFVGGILTAVSTSVPELVVAVSAVRQGALTLAVGNIIGGNIFDTLFIAASDIAYREGSIYHAITMEQVFLMALALLLSATLLIGLVRREKHGIGNIGLESFLILVFYAGGFTLLFLR